MKTIKQIADEIGVSKQSIRNEIAKQGLQSSLRKNGNQFAIDEKCETLIKSAFESRNGKVTAKVICKDNANKNAKVTDNQNEQVCDYQHKVDVLETDNKRLLEEIELLRGQLADRKEEIRYLRSQSVEKDKQLSDTLKALDQAQQLHAIAENKVKLLEEQQEEKKSVEPEQPEQKHWWNFWKKIRKGERKNVNIK